MTVKEVMKELNEVTEQDLQNKLTLRELIFSLESLLYDGEPDSGTVGEIRSSLHYSEDKEPVILEVQIGDKFIQMDFDFTWSTSGGRMTGILFKQKIGNAISILPQSTTIH